MSQELTTIRRSLNNVSSDLKQGRYISAATSVRDGARMFGKVAMIKNEAEELTGLLQAGCDYLRYDKEIAKLFPLALDYIPGQEKELGDLLNQLIGALQEASIDDARKKHEERKAAAVARGRKQMEEGKLDEARATFKSITEDYTDDASLAAAVGEIFLMEGQFEDAYRYLAAAVKMDPNSANLLNKLGIVLRKMQKYAQAEEIYKHAMSLEPSDSNLYFNMARVFLEQSDFQQAMTFSKQALDINPEFNEAAKLLSYARRKAEEQ